MTCLSTMLPCYITTLLSLIYTYLPCKLSCCISRNILLPKKCQLQNKTKKVNIHSNTKTDILINHFSLNVKILPIN